jgi:hypothetical protein
MNDRSKSPLSTLNAVTCGVVGVANAWLIGAAACGVF